MEELKDILSKFNAKDLENEKQHVDKTVWKESTQPVKTDGTPEKWTLFPKRKKKEGKSDKDTKFII